MFDSSSKKEKKHTYSKRKQRAEDFLEEDDDADADADFTNVEDILKQDDIGFSEEEKEDVIDDDMPPLTETTAEDGKNSAETIGNFQKDPKLGVVRRSKRARKVTQKVKALEEAKKKKTVAKSPPKEKEDKVEAKEKKEDPIDDPPAEPEKSVEEEPSVPSISDVSEGTPIQLFWEPTKSWSTGVVTYVWNDGYFTIEFEDDDKSAGALSYKLEDYDWHIQADQPNKTASKSNKKTKGRKRRRAQDHEEDYVDAGEDQEEFELPEDDEPQARSAKKRKKNPKIDLEKKTLLSKSARKTIPKRRVPDHTAELAKFRSEKDQITDLVKKITLPKSCDLEDPDDIMAKLTWILMNYPPPQE